MLVHCPHCNEPRYFRTGLLGIKIAQNGSSHLAYCEFCSMLVLIKVIVIHPLTEVEHDARQPTT